MEPVSVVAIITAITAFAVAVLSQLKRSSCCFGLGVDVETRPLLGTTPTHLRTDSPGAP